MATLTTTCLDCESKIDVYSHERETGCVDKHTLLDKDFYCKKCRANKKISSNEVGDITFF